MKMCQLCSDLGKTILACYKTFKELRIYFVINQAPFPKRHQQPCKGPYITEIYREPLNSLNYVTLSSLPAICPVVQKLFCFKKSLDIRYGGGKKRRVPITVACVAILRQVRRRSSLQAGSPPGYFQSYAFFKYKQIVRSTRQVIDIL